MKTIEKYKRTFKRYMLVSHQEAWQARRSLHYIMIMIMIMIIIIIVLLQITSKVYNVSSFYIC
jgi:hypothetical protein